MLLLKDYPKEIRANTAQLGVAASPGEFYMLCRNICELGRLANFARTKEYKPDHALLTDIVSALQSAIQQIEKRLPSVGVQAPEEALIKEFLVNMGNRANEIAQDLDPVPA